MFAGVSEGTLHGTVTCISNSYRPDQVTVSGYVEPDSALDPIYRGFYFDAVDAGDTFDGLDLYLMDRVPSSDECPRFQGNWRNTSRQVV